MLRRTGFLAVLLSIFALLAFQVTPAFAHHKDTHEGGQSAQTDDGGRDHDGDADSSSSTSYTEDNDTNDNNTPNNFADDGDNYHPSGKDRSVENGGSGNQGNSESDPDDDGRGPDRTNGGPDKPNGSGGDDLADQDGNNGCGNDDDFEDDNEGWCGKPNESTTVAGSSESICVGGAMAHGKTCDDTVEGTSIEDDSVQGGTVGASGDLEEREDEVVAASGDTDSVLGTIFRRAAPTAGAPATVAAAGAVAAAAGALPFTGAGLAPMALIGLGMIGAGAVAIRRTR